MYLSPLWEKSTRTVWGESGLFQGENPVRLLFPAEKILRLYNPTLGEEYKENVHFRHTPGSDLVYPIPGSGICALGGRGIYPDPATAKLFPVKDADAIKGGPDGKILIFDNASFFARHQFNADYCAAEGTVFPELPPVDPALLPRFRKLLSEKRSVTVNLIGDSISEGFNATEFVKAPPFAPPYLNIFAQKLKKLTSCHVTALNSAVAGTGSRHAWEISDRWLTRPCDLLIIAFGMNELGSVPVEDYKKELQTIMERKRALHPDTEFILVSSMTRNPIWLGESAATSQRFADALHTLAAPGCAVADLHKLWCTILEKKDFYDLTGNGVNHPNDYGHRVYCAALESVFADIFR